MIATALALAVLGTVASGSDLGAADAECVGKLTGVVEAERDALRAWTFSWGTDPTAAKLVLGAGAFSILRWLPMTEHLEVWVDVVCMAMVLVLGVAAVRRQALASRSSRPFQAIPVPDAAPGASGVVSPRC